MGQYVNPTAANNHATTRSRMFNSQFHGIYYTNQGERIAHTQVEAYGLLRQEAALGDQVFTWGSRVAFKHHPWDANAEAMLQTGRYAHLTQQAYTAHIGVGYRIESMQTHVSTAYNFGSGDSNPTDNIHQTFDNQYPLNHAYYGYMDFFSLQNVHNIEVVAEHSFPQTWKVRLAWQGGWLAKPSTDAWYNAGAGVNHAARAGASKQKREIPQLCWGGSHSLTISGIS